MITRPSLHRPTCYKFNLGLNENRVRSRPISDSPGLSEWIKVVITASWRFAKIPIHPPKVNLVCAIQCKCRVRLWRWRSVGRYARYVLGRFSLCRFLQLFPIQAIDIQSVNVFRCLPVVRLHSRSTWLLLIDSFSRCVPQTGFVHVAYDVM